MNVTGQKSIDVAAVFKSEDSGQKYKITPIRFKHPVTGGSHSVKKIRSFMMHDEGRSIQYDYYVEDSDQRYYRILFDSASLQWYFIEQDNPFTG